MRKLDGSLTNLFKHLRARECVDLCKENHPEPRSGLCSELLADAEIDAVIDPLPPFTFCCPQCGISTAGPPRPCEDTGQRKGRGKGGEICSEILEIFYGLTP